MEKPKIQVDLTQAPWVECSKGNKLFESKVLFKRISPLVSPSGKEEFVPLEVIVCSTCGKIPKFFYDRAKDVPEELRSDCDK
jgi:hypothetical protein